MLYVVILLAHIFHRFLWRNPVFRAPCFRHQLLPEIVIEGEVEQRAVHIQQNGIYVLPGNVDMHEGNLQSEAICATG